MPPCSAPMTQAAAKIKLYYDLLPRKNLKFLNGGLSNKNHTLQQTHLPFTKTLVSESRLSHANRCQILCACGTPADPTPSKIPLDRLQLQNWVFTEATFLIPKKHQSAQHLERGGIKQPLALAPEPSARATIWEHASKITASCQTDIGQAT